MNDEDFEREVRDAAHRLAGGRAPEGLRTRIAAIPSADRRPVGMWSRFGAGLRLAASGAAVVALAGVGLLIVGTRPHDAAVAPGSSDAPQITGSPAAAASPQGSALVTRELGGLSIVTPADWQIVLPRVWTAPIGPRVFLSSSPISDPCPNAFTAGDACQKPLAALPPNGTLVTIWGSATVQPSDASQAVAAGPAGQTCAALGGERALRAAFPGFVITACLRGPDLATNEVLFRAMVASVKRG